MPAAIRIGTQGWNYDAWVGPFYPPKTRATDFLTVYARAFNTVEVDSTFYAVPAARTVRGDDSLRIELQVQDAVGTDMRQSRLHRGERGAARELARPYFIQMKGVLRVTGRVHGHAFSGSGLGFFETYRSGHRP
jgi:hypothetical protein